MSGPTRFGFSDADGQGKSPGGHEPERGARTVFGREVHLQASLLVPATAPVPPAAAVPPAASAPAAKTAMPATPAGPGPSVAPEAAPKQGARGPDRRNRNRDRSGEANAGTSKRMPAIAGFWGRRNAEGELVPLSGLGILRLRGFGFGPRSLRRLRPLLVAVAAAMLSFLAVLTVMRLGEPEPSPAPAARPAPAPLPAAGPTGAKAAPPQPPPASAQPAPAQPPPASAQPARERPAAAPAEEVPRPTPAAAPTKSEGERMRQPAVLPPRGPSAGARRPRGSSATVRDLDDPLPFTF
jgi:hypothetical protein